LDDGCFGKPVEVVVSVSEGDKSLNFPNDGELQVPVATIGMS
jgi:hypothetical protein